MKNIAVHINIWTLCNLERLNIALLDKTKFINKRNNIIT